WMTIGVDMPKSRSQSRTIGRNRVALLCGCVLTFLLVACSGPDPTVNVYVDPAIGNDANPGSADQPYRTLTHALSHAAANHMIHLAGGNYGSASGETWPTHAGYPPTAEPNVPDGVTITADANNVRLVGPLGFDSETALVFEGTAQVIGVVISGFEVGAIVGGSAKVVFDDVLVSGNGEFGVFVGGEA